MQRRLVPQMMRGKGAVEWGFADIASRKEQKRCGAATVVSQGNDGFLGEPTEGAGRECRIS
jgi:hypothetical protein